MSSRFHGRRLLPGDDSLEALTDDESCGVRRRRKRRSGWGDPLREEDGLLVEPEVEEASPPLPEVREDDDATGKDVEDDDDDPFEEFMRGIEEELKTTTTTSRTSPIPNGHPPSAFHTSEPEIIEAEDAMADFVPQEQKVVGKATRDSDEEVYEAAAAKEPQKPNRGLLLETPDYSKIQYEAFEKDFYVPCEEITNLTHAEVAEKKSKLGIAVSGLNAPRPIRAFDDLQQSIDPALMAAIKHNYKTPTPIQSQAVPAALSGRDMIALAESGSGKTLSYVVPCVQHCFKNRKLRRTGPSVLILCPTRELTLQVCRSLRLLGSAFTPPVRSISLCGGYDLTQQHRKLHAGVDAVVAVPGRLLDIVRQKGLSFNTFTMVVVDECDQMMDTADHLVVPILAQMNPNKQLLMFSATMPPFVETNSKKIMKTPLVVRIGARDQASSSVKQSYVVLPDEAAKWTWTVDNCRSELVAGSALVFCSSQGRANDLAALIDELLTQGRDSDLIETRREEEHTQVTQEEEEGVVFASPAVISSKESGLG